MYADLRVLDIKIVEDYFDDKKGQKRLLHITLPSGDLRTDLATKIQRFIINHKPIDGYSIEERRSIMECGASGGSHEILLTLINGAMGGLASVITIEVIGWIKKMIKRSQDYKYLKEDYNCTDKEILKNALEFIKNNFNKSGKLKVKKFTRVKDDFEVLFTNGKKDFVYKSELRGMIVDVQELN